MLKSIGAEDIIGAMAIGAVDWSVTASQANATSQTNKWATFSNRAFAGAEVTGGVLQTVAGVGFGILTVETGVGLAVGGVTALRRLDHIETGLKGLWTGEEEPTAVGRGAHEFGLSHNGTMALEVGLDLRLPGGIASGIKWARPSLFGVGAVEKLPAFASRNLLEDHFAKHAIEFKGVFNNTDEYLAGAHDVMKNGIKVAYDYKGEMRVGYVRFAGTTSGKPIIDDIRQPGVAKFELVGTNNQGNITTYHIERSENRFWKMLNGNSNNRIVTPYKYQNFKDKYTLPFMP